jgi:hypothetical protein
MNEITSNFYRFDTQRGLRIRCTPAAGSEGFENVMDGCRECNVSELDGKLQGVEDVSISWKAAGSEEFLNVMF